jgi:SH3-like domain-containing protein
MKRLYSVFLLAMLFSIPTPAQTETKCDLAAFVTDPASSVNVRSGPGKENRIVKTIQRDASRTMVHLSGVKGDWLKIEHAVNSKSEEVFSGAGWVFAPLLSITVGDADALKEGRLKVYRSPSKSSETVPFSSFGIELPVRGCRADWVRVKLPATGTGVSGTSVFGWMPRGAYCGNPWVECDY